MAATLNKLSPAEVWQTLPAADWNETAARHLLQRLGWSAPAAELEKTLRDGPEKTVRRYFAVMPAFPEPWLTGKLAEELPEMGRRARMADEMERRRLQQQQREQSREALADLIIKWLQLAAKPANSPAEKWLLFLQDVWVVGAEKVRHTALIHRHQAILRRSALGSYRDLAKAVSRSPAMVVYLDLQQSRREAPNENFARELFELFTLGEGHYTERDIKEAARAFTGYRLERGTGGVDIARGQQDRTAKTVFGRTGAFDGDDVIDLVFEQPAARTFLPREMARFYLTDEAVPAAHLEELGRWWAGRGFDLSALLVKFFSSRLFFAPEHRGNFIKSPIQFYLGLVQDLGLDVLPLARPLLGAFRLMGQTPFNPPNVRGWVGGRNWINSATLAARRQVIEGLLRPLDFDALNADEQIEIAAAEAEGATRFTLTDGELARLARLPSAELADTLARLCLPGRAPADVVQGLRAFLADSETGAARAGTVRTALSALLQSPAYQLC
jgi:uncharacterized protein (DUF1800 family)